MARYSAKSKNKLLTCHKTLQDLFNEVIKVHDCTILEGHRGEARQIALLALNKTKVRVSKHNSMPSLAVDVTPYPIPKNWGYNDSKEKAKFYLFAGIVFATAHKLNIKNLRWGGDWDRDFEFIDQTFDDLVHWELI